MAATSGFSAPERMNFPEEERTTLSRWDDIDAFKTSLKQSEEAGRPVFTFYDGPPFATGLPHYGHILAGTIKDIVTRWAHQTGHHVSRRFGWDCHGLPVEYEIYQKLGIKKQSDVLEMGIDKYNAECRGIVQRYSKEWEVTVKRLGRWIDFENDYKTMEPWYMESVWWVFKQIHEKGLLYRGFRVMPYSTACNTPLSNFEANLNYKDVTDPAVVVSFPLEEDPEVSMLAWTTTPWTLPSNLALCVNAAFTYVKVKDAKTGKLWIVAESRLEELYPKMKKKGYKGGEFEIVEKMLGSDLKGKRYTPLFPYFKSLKTAFVVLADDYVTDESGTGVVHSAPAFGEDDYRVCIEGGVVCKGGELPCPVDANGNFTSEVTDFVGMYVKDADSDICKRLKADGRLVSKSNYKHSYPFCWRSDKPLIYKAVPSWFIKVEEIKEKLVANNLKTYWVPTFVKEKRFHNWLENARDWNVSRNRYWGTPLPIWATEDFSEMVVIGSIAQLQELSGETVTDLHRESIDHITIPSKKTPGAVLKRVEEVFDCWFESGSMPYAQSHYPFENKDKFENGFPADFIAEGLDQTRGWFYTLMVLSTAIFDKPAFKNLIVNGLVLASDGKKMSKRLKNYPDPSIVIEKYGADALRLYLINSPVVRAEPLKFKEAGVLGVVKDVFLPWYNTYRFFAQQAERIAGSTGIPFDRAGAAANAKASTNTLDKWVLASLHQLIKYVHEEMTAYRLYTVVPQLLKFIEQLTNWYVRLNRLRLKATGTTEEDARTGLSTLYTVLLALARLMAPFTPFFAEWLYQALESEDVKNASDTASVHYLMVPEYDETLLDEVIEKKMSHLQTAINLGRLVREQRTISLKKPVKEITIVHADTAVLEAVNELSAYLKTELNVRKLTLTSDEKSWCKLSAMPNSKVLGKRLGKSFGKVRKAVLALSHEQLAAYEKASEIVIEGVTLSGDDILLKRSFKGDEKIFGSAVSDDGSLTLVVDVREDESIVAEGLAREVTNRVQKLKKSSGVSVGERVFAYYYIHGADKTPAAKALGAAIASNGALIKDTLRMPIEAASARPKYAVDVGTLLNEDIKGAKIDLFLCRPCVRPDSAKLAAEFGEDVAGSIELYLFSLNYAELKADLAVSNGSIKVTIDGKAYQLSQGSHFFAN